MMKRLFILSLLLWGGAAAAQQTNKLPIDDYTELTDSKPHDSQAKWEILSSPSLAGWGSTDVRYPKHRIPTDATTAAWHTRAWKGERVNAQAVIWTRPRLNNVRIAVGDLRNGTSIIPSAAVRTYFVRYVMTDELSKDGTTGCGERPDPTAWDSSLVADVLDPQPVRNVEAYSVQPVWMNIRIPSGIQSGTYRSTLTITADGMAPKVLPFTVEVTDRILPAPKTWSFHLDLWQNPYAVARFHNVPLWSDAHFDAMRPVMKMLAEAGQKGITTSIMHKPWAGQTYDHFESMIGRTRRLDGSWTFDYTVFDRWVDFMMNDIGIDRYIYCYTMIPWALRFDYYDQATNSIRFVEAKPGEAAYTEYWGAFLKDFAQHLRNKGWFDRTTIAMDERSMEAMREAIRVIRIADPAFKISLAGNYHPEIQHELDYYCIALNQRFPADVRAQRQANKQLSTIYTCCAEPRPNTFTFSPPAEAAWLGWHARAVDSDGYLRWAYNSWTADPLRDSRFRTWAGGDCYLVYPDGRSSIRFERLIEGIQDYEKIGILRREFKNRKAMGKLKQLDDAVGRFTLDRLTPDNAAQMVVTARQLLNSL